MERTKGITLVAIQNMAKIYYPEKEKWVFPLIKQKITWHGQTTHAHVCRVGLTQEAHGYSDLLIYIDGFGGVITAVPTKTFYKNNKRLKVVVTVEEGTLRVDFNPTIKQQEAVIIWKEQWGYYNLEKVFTPVIALPAGPILLQKQVGEHTEMIAKEDFIHPNVIVYYNEGMETALQVLNEDYSKNECLHDNWGEDLKPAEYQHIATIIDEAADIKDANKNFWAWWQKRDEDEDEMDNE